MSYAWVGAPRVFNGTNPLTGGNSSSENLNQWYNPGDQAFVIVAAAMTLLMPAGLGFLYAGFARRKSALSLIGACMGSFTVVVFQWYFWGYSLAFSSTGTSGFIGDLNHFGLINTLAAPSPGSPLIPELLYSLYQMMFCATTAAIVVGAGAERGRLMPMMVFIFFWATFVYCPIACWAWNPNGWAFKYGVMDYAGGGPVEIGSGVSALAYCLILGKRDEKLMANFRPHSVSMIFLGTGLLWFGWLGFNGGSSYGANLRAVMAVYNTCLTAMFGAAGWVILDYRRSGKWSMVGWCCGAICGLIAATSASGICTTWGSVILGIVAGFGCNYATKVKFWLHIDDSLDIFAQHGVGGFIGLLGNALFAADYIIGLDGVNTGLVKGGWPQGNFRQIYVQGAYILAATGYSFVVSALLALAIDRIPGLQLRASAEAELLGIDDDQMGEFAYDYVEVRRDYLAWTPAPLPASTAAAAAAVSALASARHSGLEFVTVLDGKDAGDGPLHTSNGTKNGTNAGGGGGGGDTPAGPNARTDRYAIKAADEAKALRAMKAKVEHLEHLEHAAPPRSVPPHVHSQPPGVRTAEAEDIGIQTHHPPIGVAVRASLPVETNEKGFQTSLSEYEEAGE